MMTTTIMIIQIMLTRLSQDFHFCSRIPNLTLTPNEEGEVEIDLSDDPYDYTKVNVEHSPVLVTCCKVSAAVSSSYTQSQLAKNGGINILYVDNSLRWASRVL